MNKRMCTKCGDFKELNIEMVEVYTGSNVSFFVCVDCFHSLGKRTAMDKSGTSPPIKQQEVK